MTEEVNNGGWTGIDIEVSMASSNVLFQQLHGETDENHESLSQNRWSQVLNENYVKTVIA
jgi:hypothetical protein